MKKFLLLMVAGLMGLTSVLVATPADATPSDQPPALSATGAQFHDGCQNVPISYDIRNDDQMITHWGLTISVFAPNGDFSDSDYFSDTGNVASGTMDALVCQFEGIGRYRVVADIEWYDTYDETWGTASASTSFVMTPPKSASPTRRAPSAVTLKISDTSPRHRQIVTIIATSSVKPGSAWKRNAHAPVVLEKKTNHGWVRWPGMKQRTNAHGKAVWKTRWVAKKPVRLRAVTLGTADYLASHSQARRIR